MTEIEELREQNELLRQQNQLFTQQLAMLQQMVLDMKKETPAREAGGGWMVVRSLISGYTSLEHPNPDYRGLRGDKVIPPYSEVLLPLTWRRSPNLDISTKKGVLSWREVDGPPERLLAMPEYPRDSVVLEPEHKSIAMGFALLGADSDDGDVSSYPASVQSLLLTNLTVGDPQGPVDTALMQEVVVPVLEDAIKLESEWRNRPWVIDLLDERITQIRNLTRRLR